MNNIFFMSDRITCNARSELYITDVSMETQNVQSFAATFTNFLVRFHANTQHILLFYFCCYSRSRRRGYSRRFCSSWRLVVCLVNVQILLVIIIRRAILAPSVIFVCGCAYIMYIFSIILLEMLILSCIQIVLVFLQSLYERRHIIKINV
jgi:hypothetical protein